ncbi:MAG: hypothetical protein AAGG72_00695 [Pseudomonadota bacterium]
MSKIQLPLKLAENDAAAAVGLDVEVRTRWRDLVENRLPTAAHHKPHWPVRFDHCFARILLDVACGDCWRNSIQPPAWRHAPLPVLQAAIALGERVLVGEADLRELNNLSLLMRGKKTRPIKGPAEGSVSAEFACDLPVTSDGQLTLDAKLSGRSQGEME